MQQRKHRPPVEIFVRDAPPSVRDPAQRCRLANGGRRSCAAAIAHASTLHGQQHQQQINTPDLNQHAVYTDCSISVHIVETLFEGHLERDSRICSALDVGAICAANSSQSPCGTAASSSALLIEPEAEPKGLACTWYYSAGLPRTKWSRQSCPTRRWMLPVSSPASPPRPPSDDVRSKEVNQMLKRCLSVERFII